MNIIVLLCSSIDVFVGLNFFYVWKPEITLKWHCLKLIPMRYMRMAYIPIMWSTVMLSYELTYFLYYFSILSLFHRYLTWTKYIYIRLPLVLGCRYSRTSPTNQINLLDNSKTMKVQSIFFSWWIQISRFTTNLNVA